MRKLNVYISEKLILNKQSHVKEYDADDLNNDNISLYDSTDYADEDDDAEAYKKLRDQFDQFDKDHLGIIVFSDPITKCKDINKCLYKYFDTLHEMLQFLFNWDSYNEGFIDLVHGHLQISAVFSSFKKEYYVYALSEEADERVRDWLFDGGINTQDISFLLKEEGNIIPIEF